MKLCNNCKKEKDESEFYKRKDGSCFLPCKECKKEYYTSKYSSLKNDSSYKMRMRKNKQKYYINNKEKILNKTSSYYEDHKNSYQEYQKEYEKSHPRKNRKRSKPTTKNKIRINISRSINKHFAKLGLKKQNTIIKYLEFSFEDLMDYFENYFNIPDNEWMNFNNYGTYKSKTWDDNDKSTWKWQIDHIIPHSYFNYISMEDKEFKQCWALSNLRPYSAKQNNLDSNRKNKNGK